jgi:hypothetical protein
VTAEISRGSRIEHGGPCRKSTQHGERIRDCVFMARRCRTVGCATLPWAGRQGRGWGGWASLTLSVTVGWINDGMLLPFGRIRVLGLASTARTSSPFPPARDWAGGFSLELPSLWQHTAASAMHCAVEIRTPYPYCATLWAPGHTAPPHAVQGNASGHFLDPGPQSTQFPWTH